MNKRANRLNSSEMILGWIGVFLQLAAWIMLAINLENYVSSSLLGSFSLFIVIHVLSIVQAILRRKEKVVLNRMTGKAFFISTLIISILGLAITIPAWWAWVCDISIELPLPFSDIICFTLTGLSAFWSLYHVILSTIIVAKNKKVKKH